jgi:ribose transport system substrate-binding protein
MQRNEFIMPSSEARIVDIARSDQFPRGVSRRAFLSVAAAAGIGAGLAACGRSSSTAAGTADGLQRPKVFGHVTTFANEFFVEYGQGAQQCTAALGSPLQMFEEQGNVNTALGQLGTVRATGGKAMFGHNASEAEAVAMIKATDAAGIFYANTFTSPPNFTPADAQHWVRFITPATPEIAYQTAVAMFKKVGGAGTVIHVPGQKGSTPDVQRTSGLNRALAEYPNINVVTTADGNWVAHDSRTAFENALPSVKDFVGVFAQNDSEAEGVIAALDARGIKDKIVTGFDGNKTNIGYIADGKQFLTSVTTPGLSAALAAVSLFDAVNGIELNLPERFLFQGAVLATQENANDLLTKIYGKTLTFDWARMSQTLHPKDWDPQTLLTPIDPKKFFQGAAGPYTLNPAWDAAADQIPQVAKDYGARFTSGPLLQYKQAMV